MVVEIIYFISISISHFIVDCARIIQYIASLEIIGVLFVSIRLDDNIRLIWVNLHFELANIVISNHEV